MRKLNLNYCKDEEDKVDGDGNPIDPPNDGLS